MKNCLPAIYLPGTSAENWDRRRREICRLFETHVFGKTPDAECAVRSQLLHTEKAFGGKGIREWYEVTLSVENKSCVLHLALVLPAADRKAPAVLLICNHDKTPQAGTPPDKQKMADMLSKAPDPWRKQVESMMARYKNGAPAPVLLDIDTDQNSEYWPVEDIISRGYAAAAFYASEAQPDDRARFPGALGRLFSETGEQRPEDDWGALGMWAFAASRMVDVLRRHSRIDSGRISVAGHSRGGKAALWCAAQDEKVRGVLVNNSGCTGAAVSRGKKGENLAFINAMFPHWFCPRYAEYAWKEEQLPLDQHMLLACVAPRLCYVTSGTQDAWSDPDAEWEGVKAASQAWNLFEPTDLPSCPPDAGRPLADHGIGYHRREGGHALTRWDWMRFLDFLDRHAE